MSSKLNRREDTFHRFLTLHLCQALTHADETQTPAGSSTASTFSAVGKHSHGAASSYEGSAQSCGLSPRPRELLAGLALTSLLTEGILASHPKPHRRWLQGHRQAGSTEATGVSPNRSAGPQHSWNASSRRHLLQQRRLGCQARAPAGLDRFRSPSATPARSGTSCGEVYRGSAYFHPASSPGKFNRGPLTPPGARRALGPQRGASHARRARTGPPSARPRLARSAAT